MCGAGPQVAQSVPRGGGRLLPGDVLSNSTGYCRYFINTCGSQEGKLPPSPPPPTNLPELLSKAGPSDVGENRPPGPKSAGRLLVPGVGHRALLPGSASYRCPRGVDLLFSLAGKDGSAGE